MPDDTDWNEILEIVADLEDKLSNKDNTMWGYNAAWSEDLAALLGVAGTATKTTVNVPAGEVHVIEAISWQNQTGARGVMLFRVMGTAGDASLVREATPARYDPVVWAGRLTMHEGEHIEVKQNDCLQNDAHVGAARGYIMLVPEE